jgi:hypothetical protein
MKLPRRISLAERQLMAHQRQLSGRPAVPVFPVQYTPPKDLVVEMKILVFRWYFELGERVHQLTNFVKRL